MKRLMVITGLVMLIMVSLTARIVHFGWNVARESHATMIKDVDFRDNVRVTKSVNGQLIFDEVIALRDLDELGFDEGEFNLENFSVNFADDALSLEIKGNDGEEAVLISAELNEELPTLNIATGEDGIGR